VVRAVTGSIPRYAALVSAWIGRRVQISPHRDVGYAIGVGKHDGR
jgi:hypothetical protein